MRGKVLFVDLLVFTTLPLPSDVGGYHFFVTVSAYRAYVVTITPKFSAPQLMFQFSVFGKYLPRRYTLYSCYYLCRTVCWYALYQKMYMVSVCSYLQKFYLIPLLYFFARFFQCGIYFFIEYYFSVFCRTYIMIQ